MWLYQYSLRAGLVFNPSTGSPPTVSAATSWSSLLPSDLIYKNLPSVYIQGCEMIYEQGYPLQCWDSKMTVNKGLVFMYWNGMISKIYC